MNTPDADTRRIGRRLGLLATLAFLALGWVSFDGAIERRDKLTPRERGLAGSAQDCELFLFGAQQASGAKTRPEDRALMSADPAKGGIEGPHGHVLY